MGAIAGIVRNDGRPLDGELLDRMLAALQRRAAGPAGFWLDGSAGFGSRARRSPVAPLYRLGRNIAAADARLDNRGDLISALGLTDLPSAEISDTHLILAAYEKWGEDCPEKLLGDFAFAIWDGARRRLFCARDAFGLRPFYYRHLPGSFAFASEIKGLLALPDAASRVDETRLIQYLASCFEDQESTFHADIKKLPPAHSLTVDAGRRIPRRYWAPDPSRELNLGSDREYADAFRAIFREAVRCRMQGVERLGSTLSGGLDSSSIVCTARQLLGPASAAPLHTFSLIFDDVPKSDERRYMDTVVNGGGITPHYIHGDRISPLFDIENALKTQDEPIFAPNLFLHAAMYRAARAEGVDVLLDGLDGDTTVSHGVARLTELAGGGRWSALWREAQALQKNSGGLSRMELFKGVARPWVPDRLGPGRRDARRRRAAANALAETFNPDFRKRSEFDGRMEEFWAGDGPPPRGEREHHRRRLTTGLISHCMELADRASAECSLEVRYPFFDRRLIEFCLSLPSDQKLRNGWTRWILREATEGVLPPEIQWRWGKGDLGHNFLHTFTAFDGDRLREALIDGRDRLAPYLRPDAGQMALDRLTREATWDAAAPALRMAILSIWLRDSGVSG